jgi:hypothetical protein
MGAGDRTEGLEADSATVLRIVKSAWAELAVHMTLLGLAPAGSIALKGACELATFSVQTRNVAPHWLVPRASAETLGSTGLDALSDLV